MTKENENPKDETENELLDKMAQVLILIAKRLVSEGEITSTEFKDIDRREQKVNKP